MSKASLPVNELAPGLWFRAIHRNEADPRMVEHRLTPVERYFFARDGDPARRDLRILARAALREWLSSLLGKPVGEVPFQTSPTGRPILAMPNPPWTFSISTRGDLALVAVAHADWGDVGIDIEKLKPDVDITKLTTPAFTSAEQARLNAEPSTARAATALRLWVRKEAVAKALGLGVAAFDASLDLSAVDWTESFEWQDFTALGRIGRLRDLPPIYGYVAALALLKAQ